MEQINVLKKESAQLALNNFREDIDDFLDDSLRELMETINRSAYYTQPVPTGNLVSRFHTYDKIPQRLLSRFNVLIGNYKNFTIMISEETTDVYSTYPVTLNKKLIAEWISSDYTDDVFNKLIIWHANRNYLSPNEVNFLIVSVAIMVYLDRGIPSEN